ncbi:hypothetical protein KP509_34G067700 [Ceratopteris richardii]|uniref:Fungal lipase-type domain-containing protein n=1 Tax=Ceratopteris richardii TaxID=49495 RepID=A0A8T2QKN6_CERRI|nr:hypothetical protein KP509_34G067700 [Ceratopteris richardii]KAH7284722.1 hypothetical protein KP509_34G067700 [Ceratopteris richardii]
MDNLGLIIKDDRHPTWLLDALILSAAVYGKDPKQRLLKMDREYGLPGTARYEFLSDAELDRAGLSTCKQNLLVVRSLAGGHYIVACRGTTDISDALVDLKIFHRTLSLGYGAAHAGFLDRAKAVPLNFFKKLLLQNKKIVFTGHSLGGAVGSLLTLRLLESTGSWCHNQIQCYTFGCPFFADYRLANYINSRYKQHFVHLVSGNDFVPKAMPVVHTLYSLWGGLHVGPLEDVMNCLRVFMVGSRMMKMNLKLSQHIYLFGFASEALRWLPALSRFALHRVLALALSFHSGRSYAFAGNMMLLDPESGSFELENREQWTVNTHLQFYLGGVSLDAVKEHRLLSYIKRVFALHGRETQRCASIKQQVLNDMAIAGQSVVMHRAILDFQNGLDEQFLVQDGLDSSSLNEEHHSDCQECTLVTSTARKGKLKGIRAFRSQVACVIFTKRLQLAVLSSSRPKRKLRFSRLKILTQSISRFSQMVGHVDKIFLGYSALCSILKVRRLILWL